MEQPRGPQQGQDCDLGTPAELPGRHPQLDRFQELAIVVTNPTYEFDVARILLILMRPAIRNRRAERFELVSPHCGANDIGRECRRWCISRLEGTHPQHALPSGGGGAVKHRSPLFTLAAVAVAFSLPSSIWWPPAGHSSGEPRRPLPAAGHRSLETVTIGWIVLATACRWESRPPAQ